MAGGDWADILPVCHGRHVYLDAAAHRSLHWSVGTAALAAADPLSMARILSSSPSSFQQPDASASDGSNPDGNVTVLLGGPTNAAAVASLHAVLSAHPDAADVVVFCAVPPRASAGESSTCSNSEDAAEDGTTTVCEEGGQNNEQGVRGGEDGAAAGQTEEQARDPIRTAAAKDPAEHHAAERAALQTLQHTCEQVFGASSSTVTVLAACIGSAKICDRLYLLPGCSGSLLGLGRNEDELHAATVGLSHLLNSILLGDIACALLVQRWCPTVSARYARDPAAGTRKREVAVIVIDRELDLVSPLLQSNVTLGDRMFTALKPFCGDQGLGDVQIDMSELVGAFAASNVPPGCVAQPDAEEDSAGLLAAIIGSAKKDGLLAVRKCILETAASAGIKLKHKAQRGRITHKQLEEHLEPFKHAATAAPQSVLPFLSILQIIAGSVAAIRPDNVAAWNRLVATEKALLLGAMEQQTEDANVFGELSNLIPVPRLDGSPRDDSNGEQSAWSVKEILSYILLCYLLELSSPATAADEEQLQRALVHLLATETPGASRPELQQQVSNVFGHFKELAAARTNIGVEASLRGNASDPDQVYNSLIKQLADLTFDPARPALVDLHQHEPPKTKGLMRAGLGGLMGMIGQRRKDRPSDFSSVIFLVLGGVTGTEIKEIHDAAERHATGVEVLVAGTNPLVSTAHVQTALRLAQFD